MSATAIHPGEPRWSEFESILQAAGLPTDDLENQGQHFYAFGEGDAFGGFALQDGVALLRSFVVAPSRRRQGLGAQVFEWLLAEAKREGSKEAWLLTTDAAQFFERQGFEQADRDSAPEPVKHSAQFTSLCPASAVLMCLKLA